MLLEAAAADAAAAAVAACTRAPHKSATLLLLRALRPRRAPLVRSFRRMADAAAAASSAIVGRARSPRERGWIMRARGGAASRSARRGE